MKKNIFVLIFVLFSSAAFAQSADVVTQIIDSEYATFGQICYLSAVRQNLISEDSSLGNAIEALYAEDQLMKEVNASSLVTVEDVAFLYMQIWSEAKGGLMYKITGGNPRYAYKYMRAVGVIPEKMDPKMFVSGPQALSMLTACMNAFGSEDECMSMDIE